MRVLPYTTGSLLVQYGKAWRTIAKLSLPNKHRSDSADDAPENPQREDVRRARATSVGTDPVTGRRRGLKTAMATVRQWRRRRRTPLRLRAFTLGESLDLAVPTNSPEFVGKTPSGWERVAGEELRRVSRLGTAAGFAQRLK